MLVSCNWLRELLNTDIEASAIANIITNTGLEVEEITQYSKYSFIPDSVIVGEVLSVSKHPDADRLSVCEVNIGENLPKTIICGAPNVLEGQKVAVALVNTTLTTNTGKKLDIQKTKIRGIQSEGMICAEDELNLGDNHAGVLVLNNNFKVGTSLKKALSDDYDEILEIAITPNRGDAISHIGVARDISAVLDKKINYPQLSGFQIENNFLPFTVNIENPEFCIRYSGLALDNITVSDSPEWLKNRLVSLGISSINNVVDITNYVMMECGQPLHAFDIDKLDSNHIIVKTLPAGTIFKSLDGQEKILSGQEIMICDSNKAVAMGGVMGGENSMITEKTTRVFLESACFSPSSIRKTAKLHGFNTDASYRFERGTDPELTIFALKRAALLIKEICNAQISSDIIDCYPVQVKKNIVHLEFSFVDKFLGNKIIPEIPENILLKLDYNILEKNNNNLTLEVPSYRTDVSRPVDVIEDFLRIYGYNKISIDNHTTGPLPQGKIETFSNFFNKISSFLQYNGFSEILTPSFLSSQIINEHCKEDEIMTVKTINSVNSNFDTLRHNFLYSGLEAVSFNYKRSNYNIRLFESGHIYYKNEKNNFIEKEKIAFWTSGNIYEENWITPSQKCDFYYLKSVVENILSLSGISSYSMIINDQTSKHHLYKAEYILNDTEIAFVSQVNPELLSVYDIKSDVFYAELHVDNLIQCAGRKKTTYVQPSKYPATQRDLSLLIPSNVLFSQIIEILNSLNIDILTETHLIDVYQGNNIEHGEKSYTIRMKFQDETTTLTDAVIDKHINRIISSLTKNINARIRK